MPAAKLRPTGPSTNHAARHVLAAVGPGPLDHRDRAGVAHREPVSRAAGREQLAARGAVQHGVAQQDLLIGKTRVHALPERPDHELAARESLSDIIICLALELEA